MSILIGKHEFDGPFNDVDSLEEKEGLYVVLNFKDEQYELIHVAQADNIRERIQLLPSAKPDGKSWMRGSVYAKVWNKRTKHSGWRYWERYWW